jgi:hypothetical protein
MKHAMGLNMKKLYLVISIVVILAIVCSPVLAISKGDLISYYKVQSVPTIPAPTSTPTATLSPFPFGDKYPLGEVGDKYPFIRADTYYPQIPASYYEYSKFPEPTPAPTMSWEEWREMMDRAMPYKSVFE